MKKQIIFLGIILSIISILLCGCVQDNSSVITALEGLEYTNTPYGFGLNPPDDWTTDEEDPYVTVRFYGPIINDFNINLGISGPEVYEQGLTLSGLIDDMKEAYPSVFTDFNYISSDPITINEMDAYDFIYTFTMENVELKQIQYLVEKGNKVSIITFTTTQDVFDDYIDIVEESLTSFTIV